MPPRGHRSADLSSSYSWHVRRRLGAAAPTARLRRATSATYMAVGTSSPAEVKGMYSTENSVLFGLP